MLSQLAAVGLVVAITLWLYMSAAFVVAMRLKRNDVADVAWGLGFVVAAIASLVKTGNHSAPSLLVLTLVAIWGLRLSWHIGSRNLRKPEDYRYKAKRDAWGSAFAVRSYFEIFMAQWLFVLLVAAPILVVFAYAGAGLSPLVILGGLLWIFGFLFEAIGDRQLRAFLSYPDNRGHVMNKGLWRYTRHPNYFGEVTQWWAIGLIVLVCPYGWIGLIGPAVITYLIVKVSGVPLLENKHADDPEYQAYKRRTSMLVPLPSKRYF